ncbi:MAG: hypothetical protein OQL16_06635 [Gammaproteobacteria bacterium]|nr:hypothetical protein [Gammaproteobacteria bacterium]
MSIDPFTGRLPAGHFQGSRNNIKTCPAACTAGHTSSQSNEIQYSSDCHGVGLAVRNNIVNAYQDSIDTQRTTLCESDYYPVLVFNNAA